MAVQIGGGTKAVVAFGQQLPQAISAVSSMFDETSKLGKFLGGPWGVALGVATAVLIPLIAKLAEVATQADETSAALTKMVDDYYASLRQVSAASEILTKSSEAIATASAQEADARRRVADEEAALNAIRFSGDADAIAASVARIASAKAEEEAAKRAGEAARVTADDLIATSTALGKAAEFRARHTKEVEKNTKATKTNNDALREAKERAREVHEAFTEAFGGNFYGDLMKGATALERLETQAQDAAIATTRLNEELAELRQLQSTDDGLNFGGAIEKRIGEIEDELDPQGKPIRERADLYAAGGRAGEQGGRLQKQMEEQRKVIDQLNEMGASTQAATRDLAAMQVQFEDLATSPAMKQFADSIAETFEQFADDIGKVIEGTMKLSKAFENAAKKIVADVVKILVKMALMQAMTAMFGGGGLTASVGSRLGFADGAAFQHGKVLEFAKGAAFIDGQVKKFAAGGVVSSPTFFPMANGGVGLMGEAGPEAVMPLRRGANGKLGVQAAAPVVNIYNQAPGVAVETGTGRNGELEIIIQAVDASRKAVAADIRRGGNPVSRSIEGAYGVGRGR